MRLFPLKKILALLLLYAVAAESPAGKQPINTDPEPDLRAEGFFSLFDGKKLDGWVPRKGKNGQIVFGPQVEMEDLIINEL